MAKHTALSSSEKVLTHGGGGSSGQKVQTQPSPSLAQEESPKPSSPSPQAEKPDTSTHPGVQPSSSGEKRGKADGLTIPKSTLVGTLNWATRLLAHKSLAVVEEVRDADGALEGYVIRLDAKHWMLTQDNLLALRENEEK